MNQIKPNIGGNVLFLQGPMGTFFRNLERTFIKNGAKTYKIGFNAGDEFFANKKSFIPYRDTKEAWSSFIESFLKEKKIDKIFLFGDCRYYQSVTITKAKKLGINAYVFEEGYIRPDYITLERFGVNDKSVLSRDAEFYRQLSNLSTPKPSPTHASFAKLTIYTIFYYLIGNIFAFRYPHYQHHRSFSAIKEGALAWVNLGRKILYKFTEHKVAHKVYHEIQNHYYFVPLQTYNDFQLTRHSDFESIESFITHVITSFALYAPKNTFLVIKHHPVDRGRKNYSHYIQETAKIHDVLARVIGVHDLHLPTCLKHAIGTITINSTVGLSSIYHQTPTITLGRAIYDIEGLTCHKLTLDSFWTQFYKPDTELYEKYRNYLIQTTQINASFYGRIHEDIINFT